jgi:hypothetical protein
MTESLDRPRMAFGPGTPAPLLDHGRVELAADRPARLWRRDRRDTSILGRARVRELRAGIAWRPKRPLRVPVGARLHGPPPECAAAGLPRDWLRGDGAFDSATVRALVMRHRADPCSDGRRPWATLGVGLRDERCRRPTTRLAAEGERRSPVAAGRA